MPAAIEYNPEDKALREAASGELGARRKVIDINFAYYAGNHRKPLKDDKDNVIINVARQADDETVAFLVPDMPTLEVGADMTTKTADEEYLAERWEESGGAVLLGSMASFGTKGGHVYARIIPREDGKHEILALDPRNVITFWDADDYRRPLWHEIHWEEKRTGGNGYVPGVNMRQDIVDRGGQWEIITFEEVNGNWKRVDEEGEDWMYPLGPIVQWQHMTAPGEFYGAHEYAHRGLNDAINAVASDIKSILRYHAFPTTVGTGFEAKELQETSVNGLLTVAAADARVYNVEMESDLAASMNMLTKLEETYFRQSRVVVVKGGLDAFRGMTNLGIRAAFMPMIAKTEGLRRNYGKGIERICQVLLMLNVGDPDAQIGIGWGNSLPVDQTEELTLLERMIARGLMSKKTAALRLGLDYDQEQAQMTDEALENDILRNGAPVGVSL